MTWMLNKPPLDVQAEARKQVIRKKHAGAVDAFLYWCEMGLGKTGMVLNEFAEYHVAKKVDFLIVVTLNSFKQGWVDEAINFGLKFKIGVWPDCRDTPHTKMHGMIINYEALIGAGGERVIEILKDRKVYLAFDECHKIKNPDSTVTKWMTGGKKNGRAFDGAYKLATVRRGLTGTPMAQDVMDLYPQLRLGGALDGWNQYAFRNKYAQLGGFMGKQVVGYKVDMLPELHRLMDRHSFRATKKDWLDLPLQTWNAPLKMEMPPKLKAKYKEMQEEFILQLSNETNITADMVISQILKLQQISSGFIYDGERVTHHLASPDEMPKYQAVVDIASGLEGASKLIVFAHFRPTIDRLSMFISKKLGYRPAIFMGGMKSGDIAIEKASFNSDEGPDILIAQTSVGSATHTLLGGTARPCYTTAFFENSFNKIDRMQAESRNHRKGQKYPVSYWDFVSSPVEMKPIKALQTKGDLIKAVIEGIRGI